MTILNYKIITIRNEVAKVMFLHLSVCPQGRGSASVHGGIPPPLGPVPAGAAPRDQIPLEQVPLRPDPLGAGTPFDQTLPSEQAPPRTPPPP